VPKLTDAELGELLRETFADREQLVDHLPEATDPPRRRNPAPILLAAAAVLAVLAGVLYGVNRDPSPSVTTTAVSEEGDIWGAAIAAIARRSEPADGWQVLQVFGQGARPHTQQPKTTPSPVVTFSAAAKDRIEEAVRPLAPIQWDAPDEGCTPRRVATVTVGPVATKADHREVHASIFYDCGRGAVLTYRIENVDNSWKVTGTVGQVTSVQPAGG
jgi:hypothetical protein